MCGFYHGSFGACLSKGCWLCTVQANCPSSVTWSGCPIRRPSPHISRHCAKQNVMRLSTSEFIRRFLIHVLPDRFHRIRHYGLLASSQRKTNIAKVRILLGAQAPKKDDPPVAEVIPLTLREPCPDCGGAMHIIETFRRGQKPQSRAPPRKAVS